MSNENLDEQPHRVVCSWCGATMRPGREPVSHSICAGCVERAERDAGLRGGAPAGSTDRMEGAALMHEVEQLDKVPSWKQWNHSIRAASHDGNPPWDARALGRVLLRVGPVGDHGVEARGDEWHEVVMHAGRAIDRERRQSAEERWRAYRRREAWEVAGTVAFGVGLGMVAWLMMVW